MKKRIWIMNHYATDTYFERGGRHYYFAKYLKQAGYEPVIFGSNAVHGESVLYFQDPSLWHEHWAEEIDVPYVFVRSRAYSGNGKQRVLNMVDFYRNVQKAAKEYAALHGAPDVIFASSVHPLTLVAGLRLAKHFGVKCICEVRDLWPESIVAYGVAGANHPAVRLLRRLEKWIYKKADALVFTMEGAYDYIREQGWEKDITRDKVFYINNGVDLEPFANNRERHPVDDEDLNDPELFKVIYAGSIRKGNDLGMLLDVAKEVKDPKVRFLIWGSGDEESMLRQRLVDENITNVRFKGRVEKKYVPYIAGRADLNYLDPFTDGIARYGISSNKLFEYFAAGKPILMGFSGCHNPAEPYGCAMTCTPDADSLLQGFLRVLDMPRDEYQKMCEGAGQAAEHYSFSNLTNILVDIMEQIL